MNTDASCKPHTPQRLTVSVGGAENATAEKADLNMTDLQKKTSAGDTNLSSDPSHSTSVFGRLLKTFLFSEY